MSRTQRTTRLFESSRSRSPPARSLSAVQSPIHVELSSFANSPPASSNHLGGFSTSLSPEIYRSIARLLPQADLATLCRVSPAFLRAARPVLYEAVFAHEGNSVNDTNVCRILAVRSELAWLVRSMTVIGLRDTGKARVAESDDDDEEDEKSDSIPQGEETSEPEAEESPLPSPFWTILSQALANTIRLRNLTIDIPSPTSPAVGYGWILGATDCSFRLHTFRCDFDWDASLVAFLETQSDLHDLYIRDYRDLALLPVAPSPSATKSTRLLLPSLATLECTFSEAAVLLAPHRSLRRLKTAFSTPPHLSNRGPELRSLVAALRASAGPLVALDVGDASEPETAQEAEEASMQLLSRVAHARAGTMAKELRYLGTLILPVAGKKRLQFYGILRRLPALICVELDVTAWTPSPSSFPALRALAGELRLYCRGVDTITFVHGEYLDRTVVCVDSASGVLKIDRAADAASFWRRV
ncbi:hypothetical protein HMN09_01079900 [Mycena chlorophos]|uniref:F-box domain-containing protein n=1 Tax=Mycena chlorophos TaxID=658473 RepID=A0A8H6SD23_MYCCL|nr:hypothetical protein HMN09_01079900 [Mycena chlorophos]